MSKTAIISLFLLASCTVGPKYLAPETEFTEQFTSTNETSGQFISLNDWWLQFDDPILNEMIQEALDNNNNLLIALENIEKTRAQYDFAFAKLWPQIDFQSSIIKQKLSQTLCNGANICGPINTTYSFGFNSSWEIDLFGRLRSEKNAALFEFEASENNFRNIYISLIGEITNNYTLLRSLQHQILLTQKQIEVYTELVHLANVRYFAGLKAEIEPLQAKSLLDSLNATLPPLESLLNQTTFTLSVLIGRQPEAFSNKWLNIQPILQAKGKVPVGVPSDLLRRRPDIMEKERLLAAANAKISANQALLFPSFSLTSFFGFESFDVGKLFKPLSRTWGVGPNAFWPLVDFGKIRSEIDFSKAEERQAFYAYQQVVLDALMEVESTLTAYAKEEERLNYLSNQLDDLKQSLDLNSKLFDAGLVSFTQVLDAKQQVLFLEQQIIESETNLSQNLIFLYKSLGGEWSCLTTP